MLGFHSSFIGYTESLRNTPFHWRSDSHLNYVESLKKMGPDWEYRKTKVSYIRNSFGHRSPELKDIDLNNYILFTGCSIVEGIGVPEETRFSNLLSTMLNCDMYNLGIGGTGNDIIFYNLVTWFSQIKQKPKLVVIGWTGNTRFSLVENNKKISVYGIWKEKAQPFITLGDEIGYFDSKTNFLKLMLKQIIDVPILDVTPYASTEISDSGENFGAMRHIDLARDLVHPGIKANTQYAKELYDHIQKLKLL